MKSIAPSPANVNLGGKKEKLRAIVLLRDFAFQAHAVPECILLGPRFEGGSGGSRDGGEICQKILGCLLRVVGKRASSRPPTSRLAAALSRRSGFEGIIIMPVCVLSVIFFPVRQS